MFQFEDIFVISILFPFYFSYFFFMLTNCDRHGDFVNNKIAVFVCFFIGEPRAGRKSG